ncbi:TatD related DNase [Zea mays]|uniref:TatD related DNase n=1 Tax=Zea mays TaxID=4577 RepID=A0A1D6ERR1_MAIZE|nr:TatD related DNase [Zea mays]ONM22427.1 TatD related DNase [Zea mays]
MEHRRDAGMMCVPPPGGISRLWRANFLADVDTPPWMALHRGQVLPTPLQPVIVWWAGLMRGVVSIALAYNKVNLVIGLSGLSFGLELCYCFCFIYPFQNIGHFLLSCNGCSLKTNENLEVLRGIPVERLMIETDSPYCDIINAHAGSQYVKSVWPSKKKEKYEPDSTVKGRNEPCLVRQVLEVVAGSKGISDIEGLSRTLYHNTCRLFFPQDLDASANAQLESGTTVQDC